MAKKRVRLEKSGYSITLGQPVANAAGGMGQNYLHETNDGMFLKEMFGEFPEKKVRYLLENPVIPSRNGHNFAMPLDIGIDEDSGEAKYYLMKKVENAVDLVDIMSAADWLPLAYKIRVSLNKVRGLIDLERAGYLPGDMPNAMVGPGAVTTEIDTDSWQISRPDVKFICGVGKKDWLSPELLVRWREGRLADISTTPTHIAWSLPISLWMILRGDHPFECHYVGQGRKPRRSYRIEHGCWGFANGQPDFRPRRGTEPLETLDPELRFLFRKTFEFGHRIVDERPKLGDWESVLTRLDTVGDVTLSHSEWDCVRSGRIPPRRIKRPRRKPPRKRHLVALTVATSLGVTAYTAGSYGPASQVFSMLPSLTAPGKELSQKAFPDLAKTSEHTQTPRHQSAANPGERFIESPPQLASRPPAIALHLLRASDPGTLPSLWKEIQKGIER